MNIEYYPVLLDTNERQRAHKDSCPYVIVGSYLSFSGHGQPIREQFSSQTSASQMKTEQIHFRRWFRAFFRYNRRTRLEHLHWARLLLEGESELSGPVVPAAELYLPHAHTRVSWGRHLEPVRPVRRRIEKAARLGSVVLVQYGRNAASLSFSSISCQYWICVSCS